MTTLVDAMRTKNTFTENGMVTSTTSLNACVDLFFVMGAVRAQMKTDEGKSRLIAKFEAAHNENPLITRKLMYWGRDVRGGAGEREAFRVLLRHASEVYPSEVIENIHLIAEFGRWDDLFVTFGTAVEDAAIATIIHNLEEGNGLLAKWIPRTGGKVSADKKAIANKIRTKMGLTPKDFRTKIVSLTNVIETNLCNKDFGNVNYAHIPSVAMARYSKAFGKNDAEAFEAYKESLVKGETKVNAGAVYPYDVTKTMSYGDTTLSNEQWKALPNFMEGSKEMVLPICDVSGSMSTTVSGSVSALDVCISLGLYISERNEGPFKDAFVTFSERPKLEYLTGDLRSRMQQLEHAQWGMSTNLEATFDMILDQAIKHNVSIDQMPTCLLIMSDMEFNQASRISDNAISMIERKYSDSGYAMPKIVFWNLVSRHDNVPVRATENGTALISGFSPSILKAVLSGDSMSPMSIMLKAIDTERYSVIQ